MAEQVGIPIFPIMEWRSGAKLRFKDDFADAAIYWMGRVQRDFGFS